MLKALAEKPQEPEPSKTFSMTGVATWALRVALAILEMRPSAANCKKIARTKARQKIMQVFMPVSMPFFMLVFMQSFTPAPWPCLRPPADLKGKGRPPAMGVGACSRPPIAMGWRVLREVGVKRGRNKRGYRWMCGLSLATHWLCSHSTDLKPKGISPSICKLSVIAPKRNPPQKFMQDFWGVL